MLPPFTGGLHCGWTQPRAGASRGTPCSRRSPAGSIAAGSRCTVSSGTIGAPAVPRRAPLRRWRDGLLAAEAARAPAVHRRAPLRRYSFPADRSRRPRLLPPFPGGLHCGPFDIAIGGERMTGAPAVHRRAPLRPAASSRHPATWACAPAVPRRAPLRLVSSRPQRERCATVLPPFSGGLHCGRSAKAGRGERCSRRPTGGLHCGERTPSGLACGTCSRRSTAGSIAASRSMVGGELEPAIPADQRRAPLRQEACARPTPVPVGAPAVQRQAPLRLILAI